VTDLQRSVRRTRAYRAGAIVFIALNALTLVLNVIRGSALAFVPAVLIIGLLAMIVTQTRLIRSYARTRELDRHTRQPGLTGHAPRDVAEAFAALTAAFEASQARLAAAPAPCAHPDAEPVDLSTGERVAWVCANPECNAELPAGWTPPAPITATAGESGVAALSGTGSQSAKARKSPACHCGKSAEEHAREWDEQVIASQGIPPARLAGQPSGAECECPAGTGSAEVRATGSASPAARYCLSCGRHRPAVAEQRDYRGVWSTGGSGRCICGACQQSMREARGKVPNAVAAEHFEQLGRVGLEFCLSYCPICAPQLVARVKERRGDSES
jgi:hypothetical protein